MKIPHDRVTVKVGPPEAKRFANRMFAKNIDGKQGISKALYFRSVGRGCRAFVFWILDLGFWICDIWIESVESSNTGNGGSATIRF